MDLTLTSEQHAFQQQARVWLAVNLPETPPTFADSDEEVAWGRAWQRRLAADRWVGVHWPREYGGRGASAVEVALFNMEYARARAPQPVNRVGLNLAGPTLLAHGTDTQKRRFIPPLLTAEDIWCQLFSEPGAGSDLAAIATRAQRVEGGWALTGQKVWTSYAGQARFGICLARTNPDAPKHRGLSYLIVDMTAEGIDVRPLRQLTGETEFNEVFLDEVFVPDDHLVGELDDGWRVANTTLAHERGTQFPFKEQVVHEVMFRDLVARIANDGGLDDLVVADEVADVYLRLRLLAFANLRTLSKLDRGDAVGPESSWVKLVWTDLTQRLSDLAVRVAPDEPAWRRQFLWSKAASIAGGTSEIQKDIIAEKILGLPRSR